MSAPIIFKYSTPASSSPGDPQPTRRLNGRKINGCGSVPYRAEGGQPGVGNRWDNARTMTKLICSKHLQSVGHSKDVTLMSDERSRSRRETGHWRSQNVRMLGEKTSWRLVSVVSVATCRGSISAYYGAADFRLH